MANQPSRISVIIAAGGTGGHIFPAQALADYMVEKGIQPLLIHDKKAEQFLAGAFISIPKQCLRSNKRGFISRIFNIIIDIFAVLCSMIRHQPQAVISFGGYPTFPTLVAACILRVPIFLHEQNAVLGRVNRWFLPFAKRLLTSMHSMQNINSKYLNKIEHVGMLIRQELKVTSPKKTSGLTIMIIGGSQGTSFFSKVIPQALSRLTSELQSQIHVYHQARSEMVEYTKDAYANFQGTFELNHFFNNMGEIYQQSDLVVARSGASTIEELIYFQKPAILIPLPTSQDNHQYYNAKILADQGGAVLLQQHDCSIEALATHIEQMLRSLPISPYKAHSQDSTAKLFEVCVGDIITKAP